MILAALLSATLALAAPTPGGVELHAHLFMSQGLGWLFRGDFFGPLRARSWEDKLSSQADPKTTNESGLAVVVASIYVNPATCLDMREAARAQIASARRFVAENAAWVLATDPHAAAEALAGGKRLLVLALEGADGVLETEADLDEFIGRGGIRIVTPLHLTDDQFGGVALLRGAMALASPVAFLRNLILGTRDADGVRVNDRGLWPRGEWLMGELLKRRVWIDFAHSSDRSQEQMLPMVKKAGQPVLFTHTMLRRFHGAERGITGDQLQAVRDTGGLVGVMPAEDMLAGTVTPGERHPINGFDAFVEQAREIGRVVGPTATVFGTDYNGGVRHLPPLGAAGRGSTLETEGFWNISQAGQLWKAWGKGAKGPRGLDLSVERFLDAWLVVYK